MNKEKAIREFIKTMEEANDSGRDYVYSREGISLIVSKAVEAKSKTLHELLSKHPNWDEDNWRITIDAVFHRFASIDDAAGCINRIARFANKGNSFFDWLDVIWRWKIDKESGSILIDDTLVAKIHECFPNMKGIRSGQALHKVVAKIIRDEGIVVSGVDSILASLSDACKYKEFKRTLIISINPIDFLRMSDGNSWTSCMNILNPDRPGSYGDGCCKAGVLSYMMDDCTVITYTLPSGTYEYPELEEKLMRQLYHICDGAVAIGRLYPQDNDYSRSHDMVYDEWRSIILKELFPDKEFTHLAMCETDRSAYFRYHERSKAYHDLSCDYCEYSGIARWKIPEHPMIIGAPALCPNCGCEISDSEAFNCDTCGEVTCYDCGCTFQLREDGIEYNGRYYCDDCIRYCAYHHQYEPVSIMERDNNGAYYCETAIEECGYLHYCEDCGALVNDLYAETVVSSDGHWFCNEECANNGGYVFCEETGEFEKEEKEEK